MLMRNSEAQHRFIVSPRNEIHEHESAVRCR